MRNDAQLEGVIAKLNRANHHLEQFRRDILDDANNRSYGIMSYMDEKELIIKAHLPRPLVIKYSVLTGEIVHQARSALDHLFYLLVRGFTGFPVYTDEVKYRQEVVPKLGSLDPRAVAFIESLQPFGRQGVTMPLHLLNSLWNRDKHRLLLVNKITVEDFHVTYTYPDGRKRVYATRNPTRIKDGADLRRARHPPDYTSEVDVVPEGSFGFYLELAGYPPRNLSLNFFWNSSTSRMASLAPCLPTSSNLRSHCENSSRIIRLLLVQSLVFIVF
jgi:hypothetical protein